MINWKDPATVAANAAVFNKILLVMLGLYAWEVIVTFKYDLSIFTMRRAFKYPMAFYLACRYSLLFALIGINVAANTQSKINCQSLYVFNQLMGNTAIATASTLLMMRTIAIWSRNVYVVVPLIILALGQWGILLHGVVTVHASWVDAAKTCVVTGTSPVFLDLIYVYTMAYDLLVLALSSIGLVRSLGRSDLWSLLFRDGIVYFVVAFSANCVATVLILLDLNPAMNVISTVPACVASSVVACRGFVRLSTWANKEVYLPTHVQSVPGGRPGVSHVGPRGSSTLDAPHAKASRLGVKEAVNEGVHISMEAYTTTDNRSESPNKDYDSDFEETASESDKTAVGGVKYSRSDRAAAVTLPTVPKVDFSGELSRGAAKRLGADNEKTGF